MSDGRLAFCFGVHNHQPVGQFDAVFRDATARAYHPFLERLAARPEVRCTLHWTGSLLTWLRDEAPATFDLLGAVAARGQVELLTGGFYEPILAVLPDRDKLGQIERLTEFLKTHFGVRPRGLWLAERVWEPHLPKALREAGVDYVLLDDWHFALAGLDPETLQGWYTTDEQGAAVAVFPISQRLRYLVPFADVEQSLAYLEARRGAAALTVADDGEKLGAWPGTHALVYERGWLDRFFDALLAAPWLALATPGDVLATTPPTDRVYLPAASYREMGEWVLPPAAARELAAARRALETDAAGERHAWLLRGGVWRNFLVKYPEIGDVYGKMLRLSDAVAAARDRDPLDPRVAAAQTALWRSQANDAYWHGVFGGCYLPHLRRAVRGALLETERLLGEAGMTATPLWARADANGDGREEIVVRTAALVVTVAPALGGAVTELGVLAGGLDLADVLARRREAYHDTVPGGAGEYDEFRRGSLLDGFFAGEAPLDALAPWPAARLALPRLALRATVEASGTGVRIAMTPPEGAAPFALDKDVTVAGASVRARYRVRAAAGGALPPGRWAVQWNLALTAGEAPGRYLDLPGRPSLASRGARDDLAGVDLVDEWIGVTARLAWTPGATLAWAPVETLSLSEGGAERLYQGTALLLAWPLDATRDDQELTTTLTVVMP